MISSSKFKLKHILWVFSGVVKMSTSLITVPGTESQFQLLIPAFCHCASGNAAVMTLVTEFLSLV